MTSPGVVDTAGSGCGLAGTGEEVTFRYPGQLVAASQEPGCFVSTLVDSVCPACSSPLRRGRKLVCERDAPGSYETMQEDTEVLTADEAAELLRVSTKTVLALARAGALPGEKVGRAWRFVRADLLDYVRGPKREGRRAASL